MRRLLCTDLDRTLLPNGEAPESAAARDALAFLVERAPLALAYVSGRSLSLVLEAIEEYALPVPDVIAADVGSSVHHRDASGWRADHAWEENVRRHWRGEQQGRIGELLENVGGLVPQDGARQMPFKRSYVLEPGAERVSLEQAVRAPLEQDGIRAALMFSHDPEEGVELLDVLPAGGTKLHAVRHIREALGIAPEATLFSGDSGNDLDVLVSDVPAVLVANGDAVTRRAALEAIAVNGLTERLHFAVGGIVLGDGRTLNGNYAAGIVEGLLHFHPVLGELLVGEEFVRAAARWPVDAPPNGDVPGRAGLDPSVEGAVEQHEDFGPEAPEHPSA